MDSFTFAVIVSDAVMILAFLALILLDRPGTPAAPVVVEPVKAPGKRPA
jgi:hypothetical protein